jgi:hypothetical protein
MTNPLKGEVELVVGTGSDAQRFKLVADINAFCEAEEATGLDMSQLLSKIFGSSSIRIMRGVLWAFLQRNHAADVPHLAAAGEIMAEAGVPEVTKAVLAALTAALPAKKEGAEAGDSRP